MFPTLFLVKLIFLSGFMSLISSAPSIDEYIKERNEVLKAENRLLLGGTMILDDREEAVNAILMDFKAREYKQGLDSNGEWFSPTKHIFHAMDFIDASHVFRIIRMMPKGASLHLHEATAAPTEYFVKNVSTWDNLYYCLGQQDELQFRFLPFQPTFGCTLTSSWIPMKTLREQAPSTEWVDEFLSTHLNMKTSTPDVSYPDTNVAWNMFEMKIGAISGMGNYEPAYRQYYYETLKQAYEDNIMYLEMRGLLNMVYNLNQSELSPIQVLRILKETTDQFLLDYPDFFGAKYIYAPHRFNTPRNVGVMINQSSVMKQTFPDYFAGFDLVGQEDKGSPLMTFLPELLNAVDKGVKFFFHAGETNWRGTKIDENLLDAILLNTTRIGHGYALFSHPLLLDRVREKQIAIEVCPISNQVLALIRDFRNHPGVNYLHEGQPVVVASDGPGIYGMTPLSHDYYIAFMAMGGEQADLRFLKQLILNSIQYSAMTEAEKHRAFSIWEEKWSRFLDDVLNGYANQDSMDNSIMI